MIGDGGPAFPTTEANGCNSGDPGLSVRDWFAGKALEGYLASCGPHVEPVEVASTIAEDCYKLADAMLAARSKIQ